MEPNSVPDDLDTQYEQVRALIKADREAHPAPAAETSNVIDLGHARDRRRARTELR